MQGELEPMDEEMSEEEEEEGRNSESQKEEEEEDSFLQGLPISFSHVELKTSSVSVCVIDDCKDADVPLAELALVQLHVRHSIGGDGDACATISGSYYNRALSSWEPFLEPWRCLLDWRIRAIGLGLGGRKLSANLTTTDVVNFNLTSTLVELYQTVKANWTEDYYYGDGDHHYQQQQQQQQPQLSFYEPSDSSVAVSRLRRRVPFVPFAIRNSTGAPLTFRTQTRMSGSQLGVAGGVGRGGGGSGGLRGRVSSGEDPSPWREVGPEDTVPFTFEERAKLRHMNSHDMKIHQVRF